MDIENGLVQIGISSGFLICRFKPEININLPLVKDLVQWRLNISSGNSYPVLMDIRALKSITKEAREYMASKEASEGIKACALLVESPFTKFLGNFFVQINKPVVQTQVFKNEAEAINWLKRYV
jgi:hypothetical protein